MNDLIEVQPDDPVSRLRGIGPVRARQLQSAGIRTVGDLLLVLPIRWDDWRRVTPVEEAVADGRSVVLRGGMADLRTRKARRRGMWLLEGRIDDGTGDLDVLWFNPRGIAEKIGDAESVVLLGSCRPGPTGRPQLVNPEFRCLDDGDGWEGALIPVYPSVGGIPGSLIRRLIEGAAPALPRMPDPLPSDVLDELQYPPLAAALGAVHRPPPDADERSLQPFSQTGSLAHHRLAFQELLAMALTLADRRRRRRAASGPQCRLTEAIRRRAAVVLPFQLTGAQRRVVREISADLEAGPPMARLLQGDVGCGKTVVAAMALLIALENGHQVALMAPTEILARQHWNGLTRLFEGTPWAPRLLTGATTGAERREITGDLASGSCAFVIGTHALIQETVDPAGLGLVVIDEQHRFGTAQRQALVDKGRSPHVLVMTATPIPRSLALALYGDLDLSVIDELPPGRRPVRTEIRDDAARIRLTAFLKDEIAAGGRVFVVYPLIHASDAVRARSVTQYQDEMREALPSVDIGVLHGDVGAEERERILRDFRSGALQMLLGTTVVEVGIDVPEASVMIIENAERFGLSQLHQLRGRVGRGTRQSWCVVMVGSEASDHSRRRLERFAATSDGFDLAEFDLKLRGPGEMGGHRQWGHLGLRFADLRVHHDLVGTARDVARRLSDEGRGGVVSEALSRYHQLRPDIPVG